MPTRTTARINTPDPRPPTPARSTSPLTPPAKVASLFRRTKQSTAPGPAVSDKVGGKGRPTPSRKEAEAAAKARAKAPRSRREQMAAQRAARGESGRRVREGMKAGEERYLPARDRGPVRRFTRDFVDSRFSFIELMVPMLVLSMIMGYSGNPTLVRASNMVLLATVMLIIVDLFTLRFRLRREVDRRFPDAPRKGLTLYASMRAMQMKFMRLPKSKVKIGQKLPETYR